MRERVIVGGVGVFDTREGHQTETSRRWTSIVSSIGIIVIVIVIVLDRFVSHRGPVVLGPTAQGIFHVEIVFVESIVVVIVIVIVIVLLIEMMSQFRYVHIDFFCLKKFDASLSSMSVFYYYRFLPVCKKRNR